MEKNSVLDIKVKRDHLFVIAEAVAECVGGYAARSLQNITGLSKLEMRAWEEVFCEKMECRDEEITLGFLSDDWFKIYHCINAVIYELGPEELQMITGHRVQEFFSVNRRIYSVLFGRYCGALWDENTNSAAST